VREFVRHSLLEGREGRTVTSSCPSVAAIGHHGHCCMMGYKTSTVNQL